MKIAVAGTGAVALYLIEELQAYGHQVVVLTRSIKPFLTEKDVKQIETDYSVASLVNALNDCGGLASTINNIFDPKAATQIHLNMLEACKRSDKCKQFIASEWTGNVEEHPDQPMWDNHESEVLYQKLRAQASVRWTVICVSWFSDYVVPRHQRYHEDIGQLWPMNYAEKMSTIYGSGTQLVNFVSTRDTARAIAQLFDAANGWEQYTYVSGDQLSWNELFAVLKKRDPEWTRTVKPLASTIKQIVANQSEMTVLAAYFEILSYANASKFPEGRVRTQQKKFFEGLHFRTIEEILDAAEAQQEIIV